MKQRSFENLIRELSNSGLKKYATDLKYLVAMSRDKRRALNELDFQATSLLVHLLKLIALPKNESKNKWKKEIKSYLRRIDSKNNHKGKLWLKIEDIRNTLNDDLSSSAFVDVVDNILTEDNFSFINKKKVIDLTKSVKTLKDLQVKIEYLNDQLICYINNLAL